MFLYLPLGSRNECLLLVSHTRQRIPKKNKARNTSVLTLYKQVTQVSVLFAFRYGINQAK